MKKILWIIAVMMVAFVGTVKSKEPVANIAEGEMLPIAVVNIDAVLAQYQKAIDANEKLMKMQENVRMDFKWKETALSNDMNKFHEMVDNGAFMSHERAESEYAILNQRQQALQEIVQKRLMNCLKNSRKFPKRCGTTFLKSSNSLIRMENTIWC